MTQHSIQHEIGFADSRLLEYRRAGDTVVVLLQAWNEKTIEFVFRGAVSVLEVEAGDVTDVTWDDTPSELVARAVNRLYETAPDKHPYKVFRFLDLDDEPCLEIVATRDSTDTTST